MNRLHSHKWDQRPVGVEQWPLSVACPGVNEWQFTSNVVAAGEPSVLFDHVKMQANGGRANGFAEERTALRSAPRSSQRNRSATDALCYWVVPSVVLVAGACSLEMGAWETQPHKHICSRRSRLWLRCSAERRLSGRRAAQCKQTKSQAEKLSGANRRVESGHFIHEARYHRFAVRGV